MLYIALIVLQFPTNLAAWMRARSLQIPRVMGGSTGKKREIEVFSGVCGPSYPDRRRIDSDVRAFLRQPSTPWIVFDRASLPEMSEMREMSDGKSDGPVFRSPMSSVLASEGVFPKELLPKGAAPEILALPAEPSSLTVAADIAPAPESPEAGEPEADIAFMTPRRSRTRWYAAFGGVAALGALVVFGMYHAPKPAPRAQAAAHGPSVVVDVPPPPPPVLDTMPAAANVAVAARVVTNEPVKPRRLGKLSLRGAAAYKRVYFDGKLLLGNRARSFDVYCGDHTISIGVRNDEHEIEVPCGGEFVVNR